MAIRAFIGLPPGLISLAGFAFRLTILATLRRAVNCLNAPGMISKSNCEFSLNRFKSSGLCVLIPKKISVISDYSLC